MNKTLFLSGSESKIINKLNNLGYETIITEPNTALDSAISSHADCALFTANNSVYFAGESNYNNIVNYLTKGESGIENGRKGEKTVIIEKDIFSPYPNDIKLNAKAFGRNILCNAAFVSDNIKKFAADNDFSLLHCNQGYAACSTVKLSDNAAITDDISVYNILSRTGIDCLMVSKGSVKLNGYSYGFIGGCCGLIENNLIAFAGNIDTHTDSEQIKSFLYKHNINYINLTDGELTDIGGIIAL